MDSITVSIRNQSAYAPALVVFGLLLGMTLGLVISYSPFTDKESDIHPAPAFMTTAGYSSRQALDNLPIAARTPVTSMVNPGNDTGFSSASDWHSNMDSVTRYMHKVANLAHDSTAMHGFFHPVTIDRPTWGWPRTALIDAPNIERKVFGSNPKRAKAEPKQIAANPAPAIPAIGKKRLVVALDPGHGGTDPGSEAHNGLVEKELTLDMAKRIQLFLSEIDNVDVIMTRTTDTGMSRQSRVNTIKATGADVVVSLHFNHLPQTDINLVETFFADRHNIVESLNAQGKSPASANLDYTNASKNLAEIMHEKVYNEVSSVNEEAIDAGVKRDTLFVLTRSFTPGVLLELTCISNPAEAERLTTVEYRNQLAAAIADGLRDYLREEYSEQFSELLANLDS